LQLIPLPDLTVVDAPDLSEAKSRVIDFEMADSCLVLPDIPKTTKIELTVKRQHDKLVPDHVTI
jgi:hypothetical protein